jgi:Malectin domain
MKSVSSSKYEVQKAELQAILASPAFVRAPTVSRILAYVCERYFEGDLEAIKEYNIAVEALGRGPDFSPSEDSIIRVEATRLRKRLREYYATERASHRCQLQLSESGYIPVFATRNGETAEAMAPPSDGASTSRDGNVLGSHTAIPAEGAAGGERPQPRAFALRSRKWLLGLSAAAVAFAGVPFAISRFAGVRQNTAAAAARDRSAVPRVSVLDTGEEIRICAGLATPRFIDSMGRVWSSDRYFTGGIPINRPDRHILGTLNPTMYQVAREGDFRYDIPLKPGVYELHLHFAEIVYGQDNAESAGDGTRRFHIRLNGKPLLTSFDIVRDAAGANVADERVFTDVSPAADGFLHLEFSSFVASALLSGIEILPGVPGAARPVRVLSGSRVFYDSNGHFWGSDRYFRGGRTISRWNTVQGTNEPQLYSGERWGHFSYSIPVPNGTYTLHLRFVEANFGSANFGITGLDEGGVGSRIFDVYCNGLALVRDLDIFKEAGGPYRALTKTFRGLRPNAQGRLWLTFVPVQDYATISAIEVVPENTQAVPNPKRKPAS